MGRVYLYYKMYYNFIIKWGILSALHGFEALFKRDDRIYDLKNSKSAVGKTQSLRVLIRYAE